MSDQSKGGNDSGVAAEKKIEAQESKLVQKSEVIAELLQEHVQQKKPMGPLDSTRGPS